MKKTNTKTNISSIRTCNVLSNALINLLEQKPFHNIFVKDICEEANIPRATFYNHFEDKYDLLSFCLKKLEKIIEPKDKDYSTNDEYYMILLNNTADYCIEKKNYLKKICQLNSNNIFVSEIQANMATEILNNIKTKNERCNMLKIPAEILAEYYAGAIVAVLKWWVNSNEDWPKEKILKGAEIILNRKLDLYY